MNIKSFLKLVEIQTTSASVIPFLLASFYTYYRYGEFSFKNAVIMFLSMIFFDMATTTLNNYIDYSKAVKKDGYGYEKHNAIVRDNLNPRIVRIIIYLMLILASILGFILYKNTNVIVLILGVISFGIGILYSFGAIPISRTPFGEIFSGLTQGFLLVFITIYIHVYNKGIVYIDLSNLNSIMINFDLKEIISIFVLSIPSVLGIANIMLANNICDIEEDKENRRYTLPIYIGKEKALKLFELLYYIMYIIIVIGVIIKALPMVSILTLLVFKKVKKNIEAFKKLQTKKDTFGLVVENFAITNVALAVTIVGGIII